MSTSVKLSFAHKDPPLLKAIKWVLKQTLFHSPPDQRWICKSQFFFCSFFSLQVQRQIVFVLILSANIDYWYLSLFWRTLSQLLWVYGSDGFLFRSNGKNMSQWIFKCMSSTTVAQAGKSNMIDWNSLLTNGDDKGFVYLFIYFLLLLLHWKCNFSQNCWFPHRIYDCNHRIFYLDLYYFIWDYTNIIICIKI